MFVERYRVVHTDVADLPGLASVPTSGGQVVFQGIRETLTSPTPKHLVPGAAHVDDYTRVESRGRVAVALPAQRKPEETVGPTHDEIRQLTDLWKLDASEQFARMNARELA